MARAVVALAVVLFAVLLTAAAPSARTAASCALWAAPGGSDSAKGTATAPFATAGHLAAALPAGGVGCLKGGSTFNGRVVITHQVTLQPDSGQATIVGGVTIDRGADGTTLSGLTIHGKGGGRAVVLVLAGGVHILGNTIDGTGFSNLNTACVLLDGSRGSVVDSNQISTCTRASSTNLSAPGVFLGSAYGTQVTNNVITHTVGYGIVLGPNAQHSRVLNNLVDGNVGGVLIDGNAHTASSYNLIQNNIVSNSGTFNIHAVWTGVVGKNNVAVGNCLWHGYGGNIDAPGVSAAGNLAADPQYKHRPTDYTVTGGPCLSRSPRALAAPAAQLTALPAFTIHYNLLGLPTKVKVVALTLTGVTPGASVEVSCVSGCSAHSTATAPSSTVTLSLFDGRWLNVGSTFDVRVTQTGHAGAWARVTVTGVPRGVSIQHACLQPGESAPVSCAAFK